MENTSERLFGRDAKNKKLEPQGLKALFVRFDSSEDWGTECLFCGEFWHNTARRKTHTKLCKNPHANKADKIHCTYKYNKETGIVEKID